MPWPKENEDVRFRGFRLILIEAEDLRTERFGRALGLALFGYLRKFLHANVVLVDHGHSAEWLVDVRHFHCGRFTLDELRDDAILTRFVVRTRKDRQRHKQERSNGTYSHFSLLLALAAQIGNGPVRKLPADEVRDMKAEAGGLLTDLEAYEDHEQANEPRRVEFYGGI